MQRARAFGRGREQRKPATPARQLPKTFAPKDSALTEFARCPPLKSLLVPMICRKQRRRQPAVQTRRLVAAARWHASLASDAFRRHGKRAVGWVERSETHHFPRKPRWVSLRSTHPTNKEKKGSATPANALSSVPARKHGARVAPRSRRLAPPFPLSGALACRRSTTALIPATCHLWAQLRPGFLGRGLNGRYPLPCPSPVSTSRTGPSAGRLMPVPPGSEADEAPPAGTALAPAARHHPDGVP